MIAICCSACQKKLSVKEELAGKKVKCPSCGQLTVVPAKVAVAVSQNDVWTQPPSLGASSSQDNSSSAAPGERPTHPPLNKPDATQDGDVPKDGADSLTDFLAPAEAADELGRLGAFRILKILGHGGMGVVFLGEDAKLGRKVAIKAMLPQLAQSKSSQQRFLREARAAAALEHDHIVPIFHVAEDRVTPYIVMPFLKGEPLDEVLKRGGRLALDEVLRIGREIAEGLQAAHATGLVHRDIKPANVWLEAPKNRVKILDFGLARAATQEANLTQQGAIIGTPAYMPPEQARGETVDTRCDLFSLGVVLYRMSTGTMPFVGKDTVSTLMQVAMHEPPAPVTVNFDLPQELSDLVMRLLEKDPAKRVATAGEVIAAIQGMEDEMKRQKALDDKTQAVSFVPTKKVLPSTTPRGTGGAGEPRRRKKSLVFAVALVAGILIAAAGIYGIIRVTTPEGDYVFETDNPDFAVSLKKGTVVLEDKLKNRTYNLKVLKQKGGEFELEVTDPGNDLAFTTKTFSIKRGETVALKAWFERKSDAVAMAPPKKGDDARLAKSAAWQPVPFGQSPLDKLDPAAIPLEERFDWQPKELVAVLGSHRQRLWGGAYGVTISGDGKRVAAGGASPLTAWNFDAGKEIGRSSGFRWPVLSADGKRLFDRDRIYEFDDWAKAQSEDAAAKLRETSLRVSFSQDPGFVTDAQFSADGSVFVAAAEKQVVAVWRIGKDAKRIREWPGFDAPALSSDGKKLAMVNAKDKTVHLFEILGENINERGSLPVAAKTPEWRRSPILAFTHDGRLGVMNADYKSLAFWDISDANDANAKMVGIVTHNFDPTGGFRFAAKAPRMMAFFQGGALQTWRLTEKGAERESEVRWPRMLAMNCWDAAISADGNRLVSGHMNGAVVFWEVKDGVLVQRNTLSPQPANNHGGMNAHLSSTGEFLTTQGEAGTTVWHFGGKSPNGYLPEQLRNFDFRIRASAFFSSDSFAMNAGGAIRTWRITPTAIHALGEHGLASDGGAPLASPVTGQVIATYDGKGKVIARLFDSKAQKLTGGSTFEIGEIAGNQTAAMSADGRVFACRVGTYDGKTDRIRVFDIKNGQVTKRYDVSSPKNTYTQRIRLSNDGRWMAASWGGGGTSGIWHLTNAEAKQLRGERGSAGGFSPDGKKLALLAGPSGTTLEIRDVETWDLLWSTRSPGGMNDAVFAPDGRHLLVANANQTAYILRLDRPSPQPSEDGVGIVGK